MIEFLFSNPLVIIIVIGIISSLFKKAASGSEQKPAKKRKWQDVLRELQEQSNPQKPEKGPVAPANDHADRKPQSVQNAAAVPEERNPEDERRIAELKKMQREHDRRQKEKKTFREEEVISDVSSPVYEPKLSFTKDQVINGVIMSEILGPPKSKSARSSRR
ncbi:hypothetical protein [Bacillus massiliglaciei]|uniref:hypothetical protein n=1 Tax=Bacillus massiliglaciei TaxID=1816693 RepID=UPI000DA5FEC9|nr:hypothetical protein [Bacillus massiliglaciei]